MKLGLGIDAGGTYTDAVIYDFEKEKVLHYAKAITEKEELKNGINNGLKQLPIDILRQVSLVSLSTTLATNACVEGKGGRPALILIGCDRRTILRYGHEYGLPDIGEMIFIEGGHTYDGDIKSEPDWELLKQLVNEKKHMFNSFAIVELCGNANPEYEIKASEMICELASLPVVYSSAVSRELNFMKRSASAYINAQLIPLLSDFLDAVKVVLSQYKIDAPVVVVRGDGTLMSEEFTRNMPVETLLSGPAASVIGAYNLSGKKDCIVVDMGGTTSDLAVVKDGMVKYAHDGVIIGGWKTGTRSIMVKPVGLGGDSLISFDGYNNLVISEVRAAPLSWLSSRSPEVLKEMDELYWEKRVHSNSLCEFFYLVKDISSNSFYNEKETAICSALRNGPLSIRKLASTLGTSIYELQVKRLEQHGIIMRSALTPTDIMHLNGDFTAWNKEGSRYGAMIMADRLGMKLDELIYTVNRKVKEKLFYNIAGVLLEEDGCMEWDEKISEQTADIIMKGAHKLQHKKSSSFSINFSTSLSIVGIGAPIHVFLPDTAEAFNANCVIPEHAAVANAVGAITGNISVEEIVTVEPVYKVSGISGYSCYSPARMQKFSNYESAIEWAKEEAETLARKNAEARGAGKISVIVDVKKSEALINNHMNDAAYERLETDSDEQALDSSSELSSTIFLKTVVSARAVCTLKWL